MKGDKHELTIIIENQRDLNRITAHVKGLGGVYGAGNTIIDALTDLVTGELAVALDSDFDYNATLSKGETIAWI